MNDQDQNSEERVGSTFFEFLTVAVTYRKFLFWFIFVITAGAVIYALLAPKWYKAAASVLPAEKNDMLSTLSGISNLARGFTSAKGLAALTGGSTESDKFVAILRSVTIADDVIKKFELRQEYEMENDYYDNVLKAWQSNVNFEIQDEGNLTIVVYDKNPQKAADIANFLVDRLNEINTKLGVTNASANRQFVEKRYFQNIADINNLETSMKKFQEKYGVIAVPEQLEATVKSMSSIYVDLYKKEVEYNVMKQMYGADYPSTKQSSIEMKELQKKIDALNAGSDPSQKDVKLLIPFKTAPELGNEYLKIFRNLEIQYKILEFIQPLYEQAKIEEVRNTPSVLVLDRAVPPDRKSKPRGSLYGLIALVSSTILGLGIVFTRELFKKFESVSSEKYHFIIDTLKNDFRKYVLMKKR